MIKEKRISEENLKQGKFLHIFVCFQGLNALSKLTNKLHWSENFPGCTLRHTSQAYVCMPGQGISFHSFAVPLGHSWREESSLLGRMFAQDYSPTGLQEPFPPQREEHETRSA